MSNLYRAKIARLKSLKEDYEKAKNLVETLKQLKQAEEKLLQVVTDSTRKALTEVSQKVLTDIATLLEENENAIKEYETLEQELRLNNLRFVLFHLIKGEGLSYEEFANKLGYSEYVIKLLIYNGDGTRDLLHSVCNYFNLEVTKDYLDQINKH